MKFTREHLTQIRPLHLVVALALMSACGSGSDGSSDSVTDSDSESGVDSDNGGDGGADSNSDAETTSIDLTGVLLTGRSSDCSDYADVYMSMVRDVNRNLGFTGDLTISVTDDHCVFSSNAIPNHDFNDGPRSFVNPAQTQAVTFRVPRTLAMASEPTALSLRTDNAVFLNGVKLDLLAAGCFGVGDGRIGCFELGRPFRYDPMAETADFGTDSHNAHTQPDGTYHYHGNPNALFADDDSAASPVIGFAADGYPIYGSYFSDDGTVRKASSSYRLKSGNREAVAGVDPGEGPTTARTSTTISTRPARATWTNATA